MNQAHVEPPQIPLIKGTYSGNSEKDFVKLKLCRDPTSNTSYPNEFSIYLFDNGGLETFLLYVRNFNMNLAATGTLETGAKM